MPSLGTVRKSVGSSGTTGALSSSVSAGALQISPAEETPEEPAVEETSPEEQAPAETEEESAPVVPDDPTLFLTVPRLGIYGHTVRNDDSEYALDLGAAKLPETGFPWQKEDTNTYIACHRLGWPGNESYNQCLNLPAMQTGDKIVLSDTLGRVYEYRVADSVQVTPEDTWITKPVKGRDMVSLQTCIETLGDIYTMGPNWSARYIVRAELVT